MKGIQHAIEVFVDVGVQPVGADSDDDGNQHRVRSPIAGGAVQECCGRPSRRSRSTSCVAFVHRVGYSIGYSSGAPRLRHVHDVRFRLFMRRRYRGPRRIHSHRPRRGSPSAGARRGERRDHRSISGRYLHPDRKSVTNAQSGGRCLSRLQRDRPQPVQELLRGADDEHAPILPADGPVLAAYSGQPARADMTERQRGSSRVRRACAAGRRVAVVALADPYMSVWQGTVSAGRCLVVRIRGTAGVTVGRIDRVPGSEDGRFERGGPGRTCDGAG